MTTMTGPSNLLGVTGFEREYLLGTPRATLVEETLGQPEADLHTRISFAESRSGTPNLARKPYYWYYGDMKTTLELPDDLMREIKIRAVKENRKLKDAIADLLKRGLSQKTVEPTTVRNLVKLPLVQCAHEARPGEEMTPERVARVLLEEESETRRGALR